MAAIRCPYCGYETIVDVTVTFEDGDVFDCENCEVELHVEIGNPHIDKED